VAFDGVAELLDLDIELLDHQAEVVLDDESDILALEGGLGCGKTVAGIVKMLALIDANPGVAGLWIEPTRDLIGSIFLATVDELFEQWCIPYEFRTVWRGRRDVLLVYPGEARETPVYLRSGDVPKRIVGFKVGWFIVDEADQQEREVWKRAGQRLRDKRPKKRQQIAVYTPEEGFNWTYDVFHDEPVPAGLKRRVIEGVATSANVFNPGEYDARLRMGLNDDEILRVTTGKRTQKKGLVYGRFDPSRHCRPCENPLDGQVFIGADFNVAKMVWVFGRRIGHEIHIWGELIGEFIDTIEMCSRAGALLEQEHRDNNSEMVTSAIVRSTQIVPDASAGQRRTGSSGTASDLDHLIGARFDVRRPASNPPVKDRVFAVNLMFHQDRLFIDAARCPFLVKCLKQQGWNDHGDPDKSSGLDHGPDALGYPVHFYEPARAPRGNDRRDDDTRDFRTRRAG
jgi:hypothetical protein